MNSKQLVLHLRHRATQMTPGKDRVLYTVTGKKPATQPIIMEPKQLNYCHHANMEQNSTLLEWIRDGTLAHGNAVW